MIKKLWFRDKAWLLKRPSIDRKNGGHYIFQNCRFIELSQNKLHGQKKVNQYDLNRKFIKTWESLSSAARALDMCVTSINNCVKKRTRTSGGFIWKLA